MTQIDPGSAHPAAPAEYDARHWERHPCGLGTRAHLRADLGQACQPVKVRDVSAGGIGLVCEQAFDPGTEVTLRLFNMLRLTFLEIRVRVVYSQPNPDGGFAVGAAFTRELSGEEFDALV